MVSIGHARCIALLAGARVWPRRWYVDTAAIALLWLDCAVEARPRSHLTWTWVRDHLFGFIARARLSGTRHKRILVCEVLEIMGAANGRQEHQTEDETSRQIEGVVIAWLG